MHRHGDSGTEVPPLVVFAGRSNVGKSSVIRALTGKRVPVGKRPGSTRREIRLEMGPVTLVDIPGFGFMAKRSKRAIEEMKTSVIHTLEEWSDQIVLAVLIIDAFLFREIVERWEKRGEIPIDIEFYAFLSEISPEVIVVANKMDKVRSVDRANVIEYIRMRLTEAVPNRPLNLVEVSARRKTGIGELKGQMEAALRKQGIVEPIW
ncbi:MAG: GTP-binding protein EngB [Candidatus Thorarchaeota archaeon]|nr:MAG: GTP-binding protein [Candidatus Thorarchaeota archaeon]